MRSRRVFLTTLIAALAAAAQDAAPSLQITGAVKTPLTLTADDLEQVAAKRGDANRLGYALILLYLRYPGRALDAGETPPDAVLAYAAGQLGIDAGMFDDTRAAMPRAGPTWPKRRSRAATRRSTARPRTRRSRSLRRPRKPSCGPGNWPASSSRNSGAGACFCRRLSCSKP